MLVPALFVLAAAGAVDPDVAEGIQLYQRLKYDRAVVALGRALTKPELPAEDRLRALETLGFAYTVLGDGVNAELTFHALLDLAPKHALDDGLSPRLRSAFAQAKSSWLAGREVTFAITSEASSHELAGVMKEGDPRRVGRAAIRGEGGKSSPLYCKDRECRGERPSERFFVELFDHTGAVLATAGPYEPYQGSGPEWWLWAAIAAGAIGGGIAITIAVAGSREPPPGTLGRLQLP